MATYIRWVPGPDDTNEIAGMEALRQAIETQVFSNPMRDGSGFAGAPTADYYPNATNYVANSGLPYLKFTWYSGADFLNVRIRYSSALVGMLDPFTWFPGIFAGIGDLDQATMNKACTGNALPIAFMNQLATAVGSAGLTRSTVGSGSSVLTYSYGPRVGEHYGLEWEGSYLPNPAEQGDLITNSHYRALIYATDADDGTIGIAQTTTGTGENYSQTPQVVAQQPDQSDSWQDLSDATNGVKDGIDNTLPKFDDIKEALDKTGVVDRDDTVTNPSDVGGPGDTSAPTPIPGAPMFSGAGALPALIANPPAITLLSKVPAILTAGIAALGTAAASMYSGGMITALKDAATEALAWGNSFGSTSTNLERQADTLDSLETILERIAVALEALSGELVRDDGDPIAKPGLVNVTELASQARSEIEVQTHGTRFIASTGIAYTPED